MTKIQDTEARVPQCIGLIMDGNRRWAREQGLPISAGHERGAEVLKSIVGWAAARSVSHLILYAFSTENWKRPQIELDSLMALLGRVLERIQADVGPDTRIRFIGDRARFGARYAAQMDRIEEETAGNEGIAVVLALSYGGRSEIVAAANAAIAAGRTLDEAAFSALLSTAGIPDPDLIIRTGGERRLSNFLPWQSVYSELFFSDTRWPDFTEGEFDDILREYAARERSRGA